MKFHTNKDNKNYIMVNIERIDELPSLTNNIEVPEEIKNEIKHIIRLSSSHNINQLINPNSIKEIALRKDDNVGRYLINNADFDTIINEDDYINYDEVVSAFNIAIFEDNCKLSNKISRLFREEIEGFRYELYENYDPLVIDYIKNNNNFDDYRAKLNGTYCPKNYFVYEDNNIVEKKLYKHENKHVKTYTKN